MRAAVVSAPESPPRAADFPEPTPTGDEVVLPVLAAGLHQLVRLQAAGKHYTSHSQYPLIPGVDGVAALPDGRPAYFGWLRPPYGTFAERAAVSLARTLPLPDGLDPARAAGIVNPASSGWLALRLRAKLQPGERVLVLGATGTSGQLAVQLARALGAGRVVAAGRNTTALAGLDVDATLAIDDQFRAALDRELAHGVDIVLDYLWGAPAHTTFAALLAARQPHRVRYINIGQSAGDHLDLSSHVLRSTKLELLGSGFGSATPAEIAGEMPALLAHAAALRFDHDLVPLADIEAAWQRPTSSRRIVIAP